MRLKVATLNLSKGVERWGERMRLVSAELVRTLPDIVGFQEVDLRIDQGNWLCRRVNDLRAFSDELQRAVREVQAAVLGP